MYSILVIFLLNIMRTSSHSIFSRSLPYFIAIYIFWRKFDPAVAPQTKIQYHFPRIKHIGFFYFFKKVSSKLYVEYHNG